MEDYDLEVAEGRTLGLTWEGECDSEADEETHLDLGVGLHELSLVLSPVLVAHLQERLFGSRLRGFLWCDLSGYNMPIIVIAAALETRQDASTQVVIPLIFGIRSLVPEGCFLDRLDDA